MTSPILQDRIRALRRRWRTETTASGAGWALGGSGAAVLALGALAVLGLVPSQARPLLRWVPIVVLSLPIGWALVRILVHSPDDRRLALRLEEADPGLAHGAVTLLELSGDHPYAEPIRTRVESRLAGSGTDAGRERHGSGSGARGRRRLGMLLPALLGLALVWGAGGPTALWSAWGTGAPDRIAAGGVAGSAGSGASPEEGIGGIDLPASLTITVRPPAYTGLPEREVPFDDGVEAFAGSRLRLVADLPRESAAPELRRVGPGTEADTGWRAFDRDAAGVWVRDLVLDRGDRGVVLRLGEEWILPLQVAEDGPPHVELLEPLRDMVLATGSGEVAFRARAQDPFGVEDFALTWVHTRGSGESFDFRDGRARWTSTETAEDGTVEGWVVLSLDSLGLGPGDVLHVRAAAWDVNDVTGPGEGVSATRRLRVIRDGDEAAVDALVGLPVDVEDDPVLSQRMILLLTEALLEMAPTLTEEETRAEAHRIARHQNRLRTRVGEEVYSRATGAMEEVVMHLGVGFDRGFDPARAPAPSHDHPDATGGAGGVADPQPQGSRYGVATLFDPSAPAGGGASPDSTTSGDARSGAHDHDHGDTRGDPLDFGAGDAVDPLHFLRPGAAPTGFGALEELGHDHDGDPILSVNLPMLAIHDAMWESERFLGLVQAGASVPHQEEALAGLQALRENERVFPRGRVTVPPVDVAEARGTGEIDDADPASRSAGEPRPAHRERRAELDALLVRLGEAPIAGTEEALHAFAVSLLEDEAIPPGISGNVIRASRLLREGDAEAARDGLLEVRRTWGGSAGPRTGRFVGEAVSVLASGSVAPVAGRDGLSEGASPGAPSGAPFVFATLRYESGNWDSAPLVPENLIHSLARYTDLAVAPEGVIVDLGSEEIFRYPVLYLTGHLPVRFSDVEARNLEAYVRRGGFVFMDDHNHDIDGAFHRTATAELARIFGDDALEPIPNDHELYRSFFVFEDGPPTTSHELSGWGDGLIHPELFGVGVDGRIGVLYSNKDYSSEWSYHWVNKRFLGRDNTRFGVNILIYALTR